MLHVADRAVETHVDAFVPSPAVATPVPPTGEPEASSSFSRYGASKSPNWIVIAAILVAHALLITAVLLYVIAGRGWRWPAWKAGGVAGAFLTIDVALSAANIVKIEHGGWVPLVLAGAAFFVMTTWHRGTALVMQRLAELSMPLPRFLDQVELTRPPRVPGTAVLLPTSTGRRRASSCTSVTTTCCTRKSSLVAIVTEEVPEIPEDKRLASHRLRAGSWSVQASYGFMQRPESRGWSRPAASTACRRSLARPATCSVARGCCRPDRRR